MITREQLKQEIDKVQGNYLDALFQVIQSFEYIPDSCFNESITEKSKTPDQSKESWVKFIEDNYGSLALHPITRQEQGAYEIREYIL